MANSMKLFDDTDSLEQLWWNTWGKQLTDIEYPIYIPSKGRSKYKLIIEQFLEQNIPINVVVEPQDYEDYFDKYGNDCLIVLPENDKGIAYVRNFMKFHSDAKYHWAIDDNIISFYETIDSKFRKTDKIKQILSTVEYITKQFNNIGISSLNLAMWMRCKKQPILINKMGYSVWLIKNDNLKFRNDVIEDVDYTLQVLHSNLCTLSFNHVGFRKPPSEKLDGGLTEVHKKHRCKRNEKLLEFWPNSFRMNYEKNRVYPSRVWQTFKQQPIRK